jgi:uncharacterized membrane protein
MVSNFERDDAAATNTLAKNRPHRWALDGGNASASDGHEMDDGSFLSRRWNRSFVAPDQFLPIVPDFVPMPREVVLATGLCEIAGGLALLTTRLRWLAGVLLALYAVLVFPANIKHASEGIHLPAVPDSWWYHGPRLLMQPVLIWWALFCAGVIDWPLGERPRS